MPTRLRELLAPLIVLPSLLLSCVTLAQSPAELTDRVLAHARASALERARVDWPATEADVRRLAHDAASTSALGPSLVHLLRQLGDIHGRFAVNGRQVASWYDSDRPPPEGFDLAEWGRLQRGSAQFRSALLHGDVGYVRLVGLPTGDNLAMSRTIRDAVCALADSGALQWIVDLRWDVGGNVFPMMEGVTPLIGDGLVGSSVDASGATMAQWMVRAGDFGLGEDRPVTLPSRCTPPVPPRVAVLTGPHTASSGELVAVAFRGRADSRSFGLPTAGLASVTDYTDFGGGLTGSIAVAWYADRTGAVYRAQVPVDERVPGRPDEDPLRDAAVARAVGWLRTPR